MHVAPFKIPVDGKESIYIGGFEFDFIVDNCKWNTVEVSQKFYIQIQAKTPHIKQAKAKGLLDDAYQLEEGEIQLSFDCAEIFDKGVPTGQYIFEEGKTYTPSYTCFDAYGFDSLEFDGTVTLRDGWIGVNGVLKKTYQDEPCFAVAVYKKLAVDGIDWSLYQFNLEEAVQTAPETVQYLWIKNHNDAAFPITALAFNQLKHLTIHSHINTGKGDVSALKELPYDIGQLQHLTELTICHTAIDTLPDSIGELKQLTRINLAFNALSSLPERLFSLPKLAYLWVQHNKIEHITNSISLPTLSNADFSHNQLTTLPEGLALQAKLSKLTLDDNPWVSLPDAFNEVKEIDLGIDDKRRLLNFEYQGADGQGTVEWHGEPYLANNDPALLARLQQVIKGTVLEKYKTPLEKLALKAVCINTSNADDYSTVGNTRFGGLPDLPPSEALPHWTSAFNDEQEPFHYIFIAQLNCEELAPFQDYLPRHGLLYFYLEDEEDFNCKVVYHPSADKLQSAKQIDSSTLNIYDTDEPYKPFKAVFSSCVALPAFYNDKYWYKLVDGQALEALEDYSHKDHEAFAEDVRDNLSKSLGKQGRYQEWNDTYYQDGHHSINDYVFTQHESPQEQAALALKGNPEDWFVLLKVTSDNNCGFCFWDAGEVFFVIHKSDLAKSDFNQVIALLESS